MLKLLGSLFATAGSTLKNRRDLALENLALRQQLAILKREGKSLAEVAQEAGIPVAVASSIKAGLDIDWDDPQARGGHRPRHRRSATPG